MNEKRNKFRQEQIRQLKYFMVSPFKNDKKFAVSYLMQVTRDKI